MTFCIKIESHITHTQTHTQTHTHTNFKIRRLGLYIFNSHDPNNYRHNNYLRGRADSPIYTKTL